MGRIHPDLAGAFTNAVGGTVYYVRFGENLARRKGVWSENRKFTKGQLLQQAKFGILNTVGSVMEEAVEIGFPQRKRKQSGSNIFVRVNSDACDVTEDGQVSVDYKRVLCAHGGLTPPLVTVSRTESSLSFECQAMTEGKKAAPDDRIMGVMLDPVNGFCQCRELCARGEGGSETMDVAGVLAGGCGGGVHLCREPGREAGFQVAVP